VTQTAELERYRLYIDGAEVPSDAGETFASTNPATGEPWARFEDAGAEDVDRAVTAAAAAFAHGSPWRSLSATRRGGLMFKLADLIREHAERIAAIEVRENGKLMREMHAQLGVAPDWLTYFGGLADKIEGRTIPLDRTSVLNYTQREPLGVVGVIVPWNSPTMLTMMAVAPALAAGNTVVIKPSEETSASILEIARLLEQAGFPPGVVNVVTGGRAAGEALVAHPRVAKISFTGGDAAGRAIASAVGARLGRVTLELGGKSANIVFDDAQLEAAEAGILAGIFAAGGQTCIAGSRALIHAPVYEELLERLRRRAESIVVGDPMDPATQMGPVATAAQLAKIEAHITSARADGARVVAGGERASVDGLSNGLFHQPTILADVANDSAIAQEEIFGPVLAVMPFEDEDEAVALANATPYGLAAGVWTLNVKRAHRVARRLEAGTVWINLYRAVTFNSPFGGYKASGIGRVNGIEALDEFLQTKSVWIELDEAIQDPFVLKV
jgi:acyl-CoA reductase-like NAD-dependent aldehyde dehydrogenase